MVKISVSEGRLAANAAGELALFSTDRVEFSGKVFADHTYHVAAADAETDMLSSWIVATRSGEGLFVYADLPCDDIAMEAFLAGSSSKSLWLWLYDDTDAKYVCYAPATLISAPAPDGLVRYESVAALPASPTAGTVYYLSVTDTANNAPIGTYMYSGGWSCLKGMAAFGLGNWGGTTVKTLIPGVDYTATVSANLETGWGVSLTRYGSVRIRVSNGGYTIADPAGTVTQRLSTGLADIAATVSEWTIRGVGTVQDWDTAALVAP